MARTAAAPVDSRGTIAVLGLMGQKKKVSVKLYDEVRKVAKEGRDLPNLDALAEEFIQQAGGAPELARLLWREYRDASPGGVVRVKILDMIFRFWRYVLDQRTPPGDPGQLGEEDLERAIMEILEAAGKDHAQENSRKPPPSEKGARTEESG